jgi:DNA-directed RNA polymerase subunit K/omega
MNFKKTDAELTTVTRNTNDLAAKTGNIYKAVSILSKRSNQIGDTMREELLAKINEFASQADNLEEVFENREQIEISKFYESLPKPVAIALDELMNDKIYMREAEETEEESSTPEA